MIRKLILFSLFSITSLAVFANDNNSYSVYIKNSETGKIIELLGKEKDIIKK